MVARADRRVRAFPRNLLVWVMMAVFAFPFLQEILPRASAKMMSCCRTRKSCCCKKSARPNDGRTAFRLAGAECERMCPGTLGGVQSLAVGPSLGGIQSAPPLPLHRTTDYAAPLPNLHDPDPLYARPPPARS